jgi:dihydroorotate dehydrogenase (NAD+) catalytic subunit
MTASGCAANGRELHRFFDVSELGAFVTKTVMAARARGAAPRGWPRPRSGMLNSIGLQGPGIEAFVEKDLAWLPRWALGCSCRSPATPPSSSPRSPPASPQPGLRGGRRRRGQHLVPQRRQPRAGLRLRPVSLRTRWCARRDKLPRDIPIFAKLTPDVTDIVDHRRRRARRRGRRPDDDQHPARHGDRHRPAAPAPRRGHRWAVRPGRAPVAVRAIWQVTAAMRDGRSRPHRSSGSGECAPGATRSSSSPPAPAPSRWARRPSTTPAPEPGPRRARGRGRPARVHPLADVVGIAHDRMVSP